ncbi:hypothetical protein GD494_14650 [Salmonella enterica]|nr:hypothetical protein [Salmonella enterica]
MLLKPEPHPVKTPLGFPELCFVRVERKTKVVQKMFQVPDRTAQSPAGRGKDDEVIHVACVAHAGVKCELTVKRIKMKGGQ